MPWMRLAVVCVPGVCILQYYVHCCIELEPVNSIACGSICVVLYFVNVVVYKVIPIGWRCLIKCVGQILFEGNQIRRVRVIEGHIVHRPPDNAVDGVLCVEKHNHSV
ncbi:hypothetical protein ACFX1Z_019146 [Malus domestica]